MTRVVREFVGKGFRVETLCKNVGTHVRENSCFNIKGAPPSKIPNLYIFLDNIGQARLGRDKSNIKSMHARKL